MGFEGIQVTGSGSADEFGDSLPGAGGSVGETFSEDPPKFWSIPVSLQGDSLGFGYSVNWPNSFRIGV